MPDICDRADEDMLFLASLRAQTSKTPLQESATHCQSCDDPIPEKRRALLPGVQICASCQSLSEDVINHRRRLFAPPTTR